MTSAARTISSAHGRGSSPLMSTPFSAIAATTAWFSSAAGSDPPEKTSTRSPAGWTRHLAGDRVDVFSGGSEPAAELNQAVVAAMAEKGVDISGELPRPWADEIVRAADVIVTMGCGDACPVYPGKNYLDWEVEDPAGKPLDEVRPIRDDLQRRVRDLLAELGVEARPTT